MATVVPQDDFEAEQSAEIYKEAMRGIGTDEKAIVDVIVKHTNEQRQEVKSNFLTSYGQDMEEELKSEIGGDFLEAVLGLLAPPRMFDAKQLNNAIKGGGTDEHCLIEILITRSNDEITEIKEIYEKEFDSPLMEDVQGDTSGYIRRLLVSQCNGGRDEGDDVDDGVAEEEAQEIFDAGEGQCGTDEAAISRVFCLRNWAQLRATFDVYNQKSDKDILEMVESETSGSLRDAYAAIVRHARAPPSYFAERIYSSMKGAGTNDVALMRLIISRSEIDMVDIKAAFEAQYDKSMKSFIEDDCGGDYKHVLLGVIGEE